MKFTNIKNLRYSKADNSLVDLLATCEEYGEIPMTLNLVDTEDLHHFGTGTFETIIDNGIEVEKEILIPLEEYCKTLIIAPFIGPTLEEQKLAKKQELKNNINYIAPTTCLDIAWVGGYDSAQMLNAKRTLCLELDVDSCTFTDSEDVDHILTLTQAKEVCIAVAAEFETRRAAYKATKRAIELCTTVEELEVIEI